ISHVISLDDIVWYGYIKKQGNVTFLKFTKNSSNKRFLLQTYNGTTPPRTTSSLPIKSSSITTAHTSSTSSVNDGITNRSEPLQSISETSISESSDVSVPVSISVVAVIIVAVIVTIITLKRRGKFQGICTKESAIENSCSKRNADKIQRENNVYNESPVDNYDQISEFKDNNNLDVKPDHDVDNGEYGHTYFILEPGSRESHTDGNISDSRIDGTEMNDDYNTLHLNKTFGTKADDTYDTTEKAAIKLKTLHDTGCEKESPEKLNGNEEDTYNHISRNLLKNNKTDNIYGITDNQEDDYGNVHNGCDKNRHNGNDTYSHLNTTH
ncbi:myb-like protein F, partial [Ruditapes philippinarum]|uniref:myb-like protein F n=1 Tax=Ruditapes philippinarum TaxID=129788 RepID=UPI00295B67AE